MRNTIEIKKITKNGIDENNSFSWKKKTAIFFVSVFYANDNKNFVYSHPVASTSFAPTLMA